MKNKAKVIGDSNTVIQNNKHTTGKGTIITIIIAVISLLVAIIVGWDSILNFFN
jgi:hypothetical protein